MDIVVLAGGLSVEQDVSLISGKGICKALQSRGHRAVLLDVFLSCYVFLFSCLLFFYLFFFFFYFFFFVVFFYFFVFFFFFFKQKTAHEIHR